VSIAELAEGFSAALGAEVDVETLGPREARVHVPFRFPDGDELVLRLRGDNGHYVWSDVGHTFMHLSYGLDTAGLERGNRRLLLDDIKSRAGMVDRDGELELTTTEADAAGDLFQFVQALLQISDLRFLSREIVRSTFLEDLMGLLRDRFADHAIFEYHDAEHDPESRYPVACLVRDHGRDVAVLPIGSDDAARDATITALTFRRWGADLLFTAVHEEMESRSPRVVARLTDAVDKQFSSLAGQEDQITTYIAREVDRSR